MEIIVALLFFNAVKEYSMVCSIITCSAHCTLCFKNSNSRPYENYKPIYNL